MPSKSPSDDEPIRMKPVADEEPIRKKRVNVSQKAATPPDQLKLMYLGIIAGLCFLAVLPNCVLPHAFIFSLLVGQVLIVVGFVKGCLVAGRNGHYVAFDYLEGLGPLRWVVAIGFFGFYMMGYCALWTIAQVSCAMQRPKAILLWVGIQACGFLMIFFGFGTAVIGAQVWQHLAPVQPNKPIVGKPR